MSKGNTEDKLTFDAEGSMTLSSQALSCVMLSLQKCLLEQSDITEILKGLEFKVNMDTNELVIMNPPAVLFPDAGGTD